MSMIGTYTNKIARSLVNKTGYDGFFFWIAVRLCLRYGLLRGLLYGQK